jgi:hypothetical protein
MMCLCLVSMDLGLFLNPHMVQLCRLFIRVVVNPVGFVSIWFVLTTTNVITRVQLPITSSFCGTG